MKHTMSPEIMPKILARFDYLMRKHVDWKIDTSYRKYATARDNLIDAFVVVTGYKREVFTSHMAQKLFEDMHPEYAEKPTVDRSEEEGLFVYN